MSGGNDIGRSGGIAPGGAPGTVPYTPPEKTGDTPTSGTSSVDAPAHIPRSENPTERTSIRSRTVASAPTSNRLPTVAGLQAGFKEQLKSVSVLHTQKSLLDNIPALKEQLSDVTRINELPFEIVYIKNGNPIHVIPPAADPAPDSPEALEIREKLLARLNALEQANGPEQREAITTKLQSGKDSLARIGADIKKLGGHPPEQTLLRVEIIIDGKRFTAAPNRPPESHPQLPADSTYSEALNGQFLLVPKPKSATPPATFPKPNRTNQPPAPSSQPSGSPVLETDLYPTAGNPHASVFFGQGEVSVNGNIASVNAGSTELFVGGSGVNEAFQKAINKPGQYKTLNRRFMQKLQANPGNMVVIDKRDLNGSDLEAVYGVAISNDPALNGQGTVMVEVFKKNFPGGNDQNRAMIYVVPPNGNDTIKDKGQFLTYVKNTAKNIAATQDKYNRWAKEENDGGKNYPLLPVLRACAISSGSYCPDDWRLEAKKAVKEGIREYFQKTSNCTIKEVQYPPELQNLSA